MMNQDRIKKQVLDAFWDRHAVRRFDASKKIAREDMNYILETARLSPSSVGMEAWRFVVLMDENIKEALKPLSWGAGKQLESASHFVLLIAKKNVRYDGVVIQESLQKRNLSPEEFEAAVQRYANFQQNSLKILEDERAMFDWSAKQTYIAMGNMMTAAILIGIDSCPIEGFDHAAVNALLAEAGVIDANEEGLVSMIAFGYRAYPPKRAKVRKSAAEVISWV